MSTDRYVIDTNDPLLKEVKDEGSKALSESNTAYDSAITEIDGAYSSAIVKSDEAATKLANAQKEIHKANVAEINNQKENTKKDYIKEQAGAYADYQKAIDPYGVNAEKMASTGMTNTGYSESSKVSMYNTYQNRIATARESYTRAIANYDIAIAQAKAQNSAVLAEIAAEALKEQMQLAIEAAQNKNTLLIQKADAAFKIKTTYKSQYLSVMDQILQTNALNEQARQHDEEMKLAREQFEYQKEQDRKSTIITGGGNSGGSDKEVYGPVEPPKITATKDGLKTEDEMKVSIVTNYDTAMTYLKMHGVSNLSPRLLTSSEWSKAKRDGQLGSELEYSSYKEYAQSYCTWATKMK